MAFFNTKERKVTPAPIPPTPPYDPPVPPSPPTPGGGSTPYIPRDGFTGDIEVTFYVNNSDNNVVSKSLSSIYSTNISVKGSVDLVNPTLFINTNTNLSNCNYMKIGNYYYYASVSLEVGHIYKVTGHMDGLMSANIKNCTGVVGRSASNYNNYIVDNIPTTTYEEVKTLEFPSGFSKSLEYILVAIGGV